MPQRPEGGSGGRGRGWGKGGPRIKLNPLIIPQKNDRAKDGDDLGWLLTVGGEVLGRGVWQKPSHVVKGQSRMSPHSFLNPHQRQRFVSAVICVDAGRRPKANDLGAADLASALET